MDERDKEIEYLNERINTLQNEIKEIEMSRNIICIDRWCTDIQMIKDKLTDLISAVYTFEEVITKIEESYEE